MTTRLDQVADAVQASFSLSGELLAVAEAMDAQYLLRRSLSDPNVDAAQRQQMAETLLGPSLSPAANSLLDAAVGESWPNPEAIAWALRDQAIVQAWRAAISNGTVEQVRQQVLSVLTVVTTDPAVEIALGDASRDADARRMLAGSLVPGAGEALQLFVRTAVDDSRASFALNLDRCLDTLAALRGHQRARVTTAVALNQNQTNELVSQLSRIYGAPIDLEPVVDATVIGGVRVDAGGDVIDGSIKARLDAAREAMAAVTVVAGTASEDGQHA